MKKLAAATALTLLGAFILSLSVYTLAVIPSSNDLTGWEGIAVAWAIIGVIAGPCLWIAAVFLVIVFFEDL